MHMTCIEDAGSGFSQTAEFHILLWRGDEAELPPSPICFCQAGKWKEAFRASASAQGGRGASLVESAFPLSLFFLDCLPPSQ